MKRRLAAAAAVTIGMISASSAALPGALAASDADDKLAVEALPVCYARGVDTIGQAVTAPTSQDLNSTAALSDPKFKEALEHFRRCFAPDFAFTLSNRGVAGRTVPDPATRTPQTDAALQWANYVNNAFRGPAYVYTQHHMGSIHSEISGDKGKVQSYLIATHVFGPASKRTGVSVVYGTYTDEVVKVKGRWMISKRTLDTISSVPIGTPVAPVGAAQ